MHDFHDDNGQAIWPEVVSYCTVPVRGSGRPACMLASRCVVQPGSGSVSGLDVHSSVSAAEGTCGLLQFCPMHSDFREDEGP